MPQPAERTRPPVTVSESALPPAFPGLPRSDSIADLANLSWFNTLLGWLWPKANTAFTKFVHDDLTHKLRESLPSPFKNLHFSRFTLGQNTPEVGPIEVSQHSDTCVEVNLEMRYFSDVDILLEAGTGGISLGIRHLSFQGRLCIVLSPVLAKLPIIGAVKVFCPAVPKTSMQFTGLASVAQFPGLDKMIQNTVDEWMRSRMVLPNMKTFLFADTEEDVDALEAMSHRPMGVLRVRILGGRNLAGVNWKALDTDSFDSDPYCRLTVGGVTAQTSTVIGSTSPRWPANEPSAYFVIYHRDQQLDIEVLGEDRGGLFAPRNFTGFLGSKSLTVGDIFRKWPKQQSEGARWASVKLDTSKVRRDMLHVNDPVNRGITSEVDAEVEWFDLDDATPSMAEQHALAAGGQAPVGLLLVELRKGTGFPVEAVGEKAGLRWRSKTEPGQPTAISQRGELCDVEFAEFPDVDLHPRLFSVVDRLTERGTSPADIADIVDAPCRAISHYLQAKEEFEEHQERIFQTTQHEDHRVSLQWQETLVHLVHAPEATGLTIELLDGEDRELGSIGPVPLRSILEAESCEMRRAWRGIELMKPSEPTGLVHWVMPTREKGPDYQRFANVELDVCAKLRFLRVGRGLPHRGRGQ